MTTWEIWSGDCLITGNICAARFYGTIEADSLREACAEMFAEDRDFDPEQMTLGGCGLFDNEWAARKSFG